MNVKGVFMQEVVNTTVLGLFFGTIGTTVGGIIGCMIKSQSNKFLSFMLSFAAGLMMAVICFDLIPESLGISKISQTIIGIFIGIIIMIICDIIVDKKFNKNNQTQSVKSNLLKTGIIVSIGLAIHNVPEGLAIGSGFDASVNLGYALAIAICFHDVPEGISMALPMKNGGMKIYKIMIYVILSGVATGAGALIGAIIGKVSEQIISICLSFAAGAMLYIVSGELIPESNKLYSGKLSTIGNIIGFVIGMGVTRL